jgi:hypothetical protein
MALTVLLKLTGQGWFGWGRQAAPAFLPVYVDARAYGAVNRAPRQNKPSLQISDLIKHLNAKSTLRKNCQQLPFSRNRINCAEIVAPYGGAQIFSSCGSLSTLSECLSELKQLPLH